MSIRAEEERPLTFGQLNSMIDNWNLLSIDLQRKYYDQKNFLNDLFARVIEHEYPLREIHTRLNTIKYNDDLLQLEVNNITYINVQLEKNIERMEDLQRNVQGIHDNELLLGPFYGTVREIMYNQVESIFKYLTSLYENLDVLLPVKNQATAEEYTQEITQLWILTLNDIEKVEQMLYKLQAAAQVVECKQRLFRDKVTGSYVLLQTNTPHRYAWRVFLKNIGICRYI